MFRQATVGESESAEDLPRVRRVKQIHGGRVHSFELRDLERLHEPCGGHPEVVTHEDQALHFGTVALPQRTHELRAVHVGRGMQPLLELVEHQ